MGAERRQFPRIPQPLEVKYRRTGVLGSVWRAIKTLNLSAGGMRFRDTETVELGDVLEVEIQLPGSHGVLTLQGCVVRSQFEASGVAELGVEFVDSTERQREAIDNLVRFLKTNVRPANPTP